MLSCSGREIPCLFLVWPFVWSGLLPACSHPPKATLLPVVRVSVFAEHAYTQRAAALQRGRWRATLLVSLRFQRRARVADIPTRADLSPELWYLPCSFDGSTDDISCLEEQRALEPGLGLAQEEVQ